MSEQVNLSQNISQLKPITPMSHKSSKPMPKGLSRSMGHAARAVTKERASEPRAESPPLTVEEWHTLRMAQEAKSREEIKRLRDEYAAHEAEVRGLEIKKEAS